MVTEYVHLEQVVVAVPLVEQVAAFVTVLVLCPSFVMVLTLIVVEHLEHFVVAEPSVVQVGLTTATEELAVWLSFATDRVVLQLEHFSLPAAEQVAAVTVL